MIGNDIVDLAFAAVESNWKRKGFLEKIFTSHERFLIHSAQDTEIMVWLLWTMKEATYKAATDQSKLRSFNPCSFDCNNLILHEQTATGNITYGEETYHSSSILTPGYIHTIAALTPELFDSVRISIGAYDESDHSYRSGNPASVSHHGQYLALIFR